MVDRISSLLVAAEGIDQKESAVFVERLRHPNGERDADDDVNDVGVDGCGHGFWVPSSWFLGFFLTAKALRSRRVAKVFVLVLRFRGVEGLKVESQRSSFAIFFGRLSTFDFKTFDSSICIFRKK